MLTDKRKPLNVTRLEVSSYYAYDEKPWVAVGHV